MISPVLFILLVSDDENVNWCNRSGEMGPVTITFHRGIDHCVNLGGNIANKV